MTQQKHQMNSQDMLMIHDLANNTQVKNTYVEVAANGIDEQGGIKIYLRATDKLEELLKEIKVLYEEFEKLKRQRKESDATAQNVKITLSILDAQKITHEFIRGFSVVHDEVAKEFMLLFLNRFNFLDENLQLFQLNKGKRYLDDNLNMIARIKNTFEKMLEISQNPPKNSDDDTVKEVESSEVSV